MITTITQAEAKLAKPHRYLVREISGNYAIKRFSITQCGICAFFDRVHANIAKSLITKGVQVHPENIWTV